MTRRLAWSLLLLVGCAGHREVRGVVTTMPGYDETGVYQAERRLAGARVELQCPGTPALLLAEADADGRFHARPERTLPAGCAVVVSSPGYVARSIPVEDVCAYEQSECESAAVAARLVPDGGAR